MACPGEVMKAEQAVFDMLAKVKGMTLTGETLELLDGDGKALAGLYACGNDMASVMRGHYPGPGVTLAQVKELVSGRVDRYTYTNTNSDAGCANQYANPHCDDAVLRWYRQRW